VTHHRLDRAILRTLRLFTTRPSTHTTVKKKKGRRVDLFSESKEREKEEKE